MIRIGDLSLNPTKIICLGTNYMDHVEETGLEIPKEPLIFPKTLNCLITNNQPIVYPKLLFNDRKYNRVDYEIELAFIIRDKCKNVSLNNVYNHILGYTIFNDILKKRHDRT